MILAEKVLVANPIKDRGGALGALGFVGHLEIEVHKALVRVDHHQGHVTAFQGLERAEGTVVLDVGGHALARTAEAGGVYERHGRAVELEVGIDGVASGARNGRDDGALVAEHGVEQRALAYVRPAHDGHPDGLHGLAQVLLGRKGFDHLVQEVAEPQAVLGGYAERLTQAQLPVLVDIVLGDLGVVLVDGQQHRDGAAAQDGGDLVVLGSQAHLAVHQEDGDRRFGQRQVGLSPHVVAERLVAEKVDAAGVHHDELAAVPLAVAFLAVASDTRHGRHHRVAASRDPVEKRGFANIRIADYGYPGFCLTHTS